MPRNVFYYNRLGSKSLVSLPILCLLSLSLSSPGHPEPPSCLPCPSRGPECLGFSYPIGLQQGREGHFMMNQKFHVGG